VVIGVTAILLGIAPSAASAADSRSPSARLSSPFAGKTISGTVTLRADATDDVGVTQAKWYVDGHEVGWDGAAPWEKSWRSATVPDGTHKIFVKAADAAGNWGTSASIAVTVANTAGPDTAAPTVSITAPASGAKVSGTVTVAASADDNVGVTQAKWYVDGKEVAWDGAAPWEHAWKSTTVPDGQHTLFAKAADAAGDWGTSRAVNFTVDNGPVSTPTPTPTPISGGSTVTVAAAGDFCGSCAATASLVKSWKPYRLLGLGDYQYQNAGAQGATFKSGYESIFAGLHALTVPTFGSTHDTDDGSGSWEGYAVSFFNANGAPEARGRLFDHQWGYSLDLPYGWHVLNFNYDPASVNYSSVQTDLLGRQGQCVLAMDHAPVVGSTTSTHPSNQASGFAPYLYAGGADLILDGHNHIYERVNVNGGSTKQFTVGTGGAGAYTRNSTASGSEKYITGTRGALKLTLGDHSWSAQFISTDGQILDSDSGNCAD